MQHFITNPKIFKLYKKQGGRCAYCGKTLALKTSKINNLATIEHVYSKMDIRRLMWTPLVCVHWKCNQEKNNQDMAKMMEGYYPESRYKGLLINYLKYS